MEKRSVTIYGETGLAPTKGIFLAWGIDYEAYSDTAIGMVSVAIVETADGHVRSVPINRLKFNTPLTY